MEITYSEKDIEDAIFDQQLLRKYNVRCIARQVRTEYGIIDILGYHHPSRAWVIIELKKDAIDSHAICQTLRYLNYARIKTSSYHKSRGGRRPRVFGIVIGSRITDEVVPCVFDMSGNLSMNVGEYESYDANGRIFYVSHTFSVQCKIESHIN